jgi:hypothetical protein
MNIFSLFKPKTMLVTLIIVAIAAIIGVASVYFDGDHNAAETIAETIIESELGLKQGSIDLDPKDLKK